MSGLELLPLTVAVGWALAVAAMGAWLTEIGNWYYGLRMPAWKPPDLLFGPAWTVIFALSATAFYLAWTASAGSRWDLVLTYAINGILNVGWSLLFFRMRRPDWALFEVVVLFLSVAGMTAAVGARSTTAALLLLPYLGWVVYAGILNRWVVRANRPFLGT